MPRGNKPSVSPYERRRWLDELEKEKGITEIARAAGRDIRVVKRHIEIARQERQTTLARRDFLLGRLELHQEDLLKEVRLLRGVVTQFPPQDQKIEGLQRQKIFEALIEHVKRLNLKGSLESYLKKVAGYSRIRRKIREGLESKETELVANLAPEIVTVLFTWTPGILESLEEDGFAHRSYSEEKGKKSSYQPYWGASSLTKTAITRADMEAIIDVHEKLVDEARGQITLINEQRQSLMELGKLIIDELDVFEMKRLVPGNCKYCPL